MMENKAILQSIDLFKGLTEEQFDMLALKTTVVDKQKDQKLFSVGQEANYLFVLLKGKIGIQVKLTSRPETVGIVVLQNPGQLVGWSGMIPGTYYTAEALCLEDCQLCQVEGLALMEVMESDPCTGFGVMRKIAMVISNRIRNLQSVVLKTL